MNPRLVATCVMSGALLTGIFVASVESPLSSLLGVAAVSAQEPQDSQDVQNSPDQQDPQAGIFGWSGGPVRGKRAITQTAAVGIGAPGTWVSLPAAVIPVTVAAGTADLFNVSFSAECQKIGGGAVRIRIMDTLTGVPLEPYDGAQFFCNAALPATHTGTWVRRMGAGAHNLLVQFNNTAGSVIIDDWTFEVVVYD